MTNSLYFISLFLWYTQILNRHSHLALTATPVKVVCEEGGAQLHSASASAVGSPATALTVVVTLGQVSLNEELYEGGDGTSAPAASAGPAHLGRLLSFDRRAGSEEESDVVVTYSEEGGKDPR